MQLPFIRAAARGCVGVGFEVDHNPGIVFDEREIDNALQQLAARERQNDGIFAMAAEGAASPLEKRMRERGGDRFACGGDFVLGSADDARVQRD